MDKESTRVKVLRMAYRRIRLFNKIYIVFASGVIILSLLLMYLFRYWIVEMILAIIIILMINGIYDSIREYCAFSKRNELEDNF